MVKLNIKTNAEYCNGSAQIAFDFSMEFKRGITNNSKTVIMDVKLKISLMTGINWREICKGG